MSRNPPKRQPLDRTILTTFEVQVADIHLRKKALNGSIAKRVSSLSDFRSGDAVCGPNRPFLIENIQTAIVISGYQNLVLTLKHGDGNIVQLPCSGYFAFYGQIESVEVTAIENTRFTYVAS
jgi:hypothetical protein